MRDYIEERAVETAIYMIETKATVRQTAKKFGVSKSTVHKDLTSRLVLVNPQLAAEALRRYGPITGLWLTMARLVKCGPWHEGGFDPVPEPAEIAERKWLGMLCEKTEQTSKG